MQLNGRIETNTRLCEYDSDALQSLINTTTSNATAIEKLTTAIETLTHSHREMTRWLLIVVCVIALGNKVVEFAKDVWDEKQVHAEELK